MKKIYLMIVILLIVGCSKEEELVVVPSYHKLTLEHYIEDIEDLNLKYRVLEEYNPVIKEGEIVTISVKVGEEVEPETRISITVSKGPESIVASNSNIMWQHVGTAEDSWSFYSPTINFTDEELTIELFDVDFGTDFELHDNNNEKSALVTAIVIDPYNKRIPALLDYTGDKMVKKGEKRNFTMRIPLSDLDVQKPTSIDTYISIYKNGNYDEIELNFSISW